MSKKPTYEELEQRVKVLEEQAFELGQSQEYLKESEIRYKSLFENMFDGVAIYERLGCVVGQPLWVNIGIGFHGL